MAYHTDIPHQVGFDFILNDKIIICSKETAHLAGPCTAGGSGSILSVFISVSGFAMCSAVGKFSLCQHFALLKKKKSILRSVHTQTSEDRILSIFSFLYRSDTQNLSEVTTPSVFVDLRLRAFFSADPLVDLGRHWGVIFQSPEMFA